MHLNPGGGQGNPLQYSCLENSMVRGAWRGTVHGVCKELDTTEWLSMDPHKNSLAHCYDGLPWWLSGKESACNARDVSSVPQLGRSPGRGNGNPLQYSCLENPMDCSMPAFPVLRYLPEFEETLGDSEGQGRLACCSPWGHKESNTT